MLDFLKHVKPIAWIFSVLYGISVTNWVFLSSIALAGTSVGWAWVAQWDKLHIAIAGLITFACGIWLFNGMIWLRSQFKPLKERLAFDYSYGLALIGLHLELASESKDDEFKLGMVLHNATSAAIKFNVKKFDIYIGDKTIPISSFETTEGIVSSRTTNIFLSAAFTKDLLVQGGDKVEGILKYVIVYGHPELGYVRTSKKHLKITLRLDNKPSAIYSIQSETDQEIRKLKLQDETVDA